MNLSPTRRRRRHPLASAIEAVALDVYTVLWLARLVVRYGKVVR